MMEAQIRALTQSDSSLQAVFTTLDERETQILERCFSNGIPMTAKTLTIDNFVSIGSEGITKCPVKGYTILCPKWVRNYKDISAGSNKVFGICKSSVKAALDSTTFDFSTRYGSGGKNNILFENFTYCLLTILFCSKDNHP